MIAMTREFPSGSILSFKAFEVSQGSLCAKCVAMLDAHTQNDFLRATQDNRCVNTAKRNEQVDSTETEVVVCSAGKIQGKWRGDKLNFN